MQHGAQGSFVCTVPSRCASLSGFLCVFGSQAGAFQPPQSMRSACVALLSMNSSADLPSFCSGLLPYTLCPWAQLVPCHHLGARLVLNFHSGCSLRHGTADTGGQVTICWCGCHTYSCLAQQGSCGSVISSVVVGTTPSVSTGAVCVLPLSRGAVAVASTC
jgi:hypothetical protein